ncbi:MAG TPA: very short patch repair endonuclease [Candidatus Binatia bacterium]
MAWVYADRQLCAAPARSCCRHRNSARHPKRKVSRRTQSPETISRRMAAVRSRNTGPERVVRSLVSSLGARYRLNNRKLPGSPDLANAARGWAIFVHGCFWHAHDGCPRATRPKSNKAYWNRKLRLNRQRDLRVLASLQNRGFRVLVVWQCELSTTARVANQLRRFVRAR